MGARVGKPKSQNGQFDMDPILKSFHNGKGDCKNGLTAIFIRIE